MRTTSIPAPRRLPRRAKLALVGAAMAAAATGSVLLGAGTALAQAPLTTLAVAHEHTASPDPGSADHGLHGGASRDEPTTVDVERSGPNDRPSADRHEHKTAAVAQRSDSNASTNTSSIAGTGLTYDR